MIFSTALDSSRNKELDSTPGHSKEISGNKKDIMTTKILETEKCVFSLNVIKIMFRNNLFYPYPLLNVHFYRIKLQIKSFLVPKTSFPGCFSEI